MLQSFYTGSAGLGANKEWLSVISDNISNVNTIGFKSERVNFEDLIAHSITTFSNNSPKNMEVGGGVFIGSTSKNFSQGAFKNTNIATDLALDGEGFFMVKDKQGVTYYTRAGQFRTDANGDLINLNGMYLQGWKLDENGNIAGAIGKINIPNDMSPKVTSKLAMKSPTNLDASSPLIKNIFNTRDPATYSYVNAVNVYDSIGVAHEAKYYFVHESPNAWKVFGVLDDEPIVFKDATGNDYGFLRIEFNGIGQLNKVSGQGKVGNISGETQGEIGSDTGKFRLDRSASLPGSVNIIRYTDGINTYNVRWVDDGNGNIIDLDDNNRIIGSIDYDTGDIFIDRFIGNGASETLTIDYKYYSSRINDGTSVLTSPTQSLIRNSVVIKKYFDGTTWNVVNWADDGSGNIIDLNTNSVVGTVNYTTGVIDITDPTVTQIDVVFEYEDTSGANNLQIDSIDMDSIATTNNYSATLNTGGNPINYKLSLREIKQLKSEFIFYAEQDGYSKGDLLSVAVSEDGLVRGVYSNGQVRDWGRIAVATFKDKEILIRKGNNLYIPNSQTYTPVIVPGGVISKIRGGFLELSNVDISQEFINLISAQRAYQANARTITTSDQVLQETMNLKR